MHFCVVCDQNQQLQALNQSRNVMYLSSNQVNLVLESTSSSSEFTHKQQLTSCLTQPTTLWQMET